MKEKNLFWYAIFWKHVGKANVLSAVLGQLYNLRVGAGQFTDYEIFILLLRIWLMFNKNNTNPIKKVLFKRVQNKESNEIQVSPSPNVTTINNFFIKCSIHKSMHIFTQMYIVLNLFNLIAYLKILPYLYKDSYTFSYLMPT